MLKYSCKLSQGRGWFHECDTILPSIKGGLTSLVLYLLKSGTALNKVQDSWLIYNKIPHLTWDSVGEGEYEVKPVSIGVVNHHRLYQDIDGWDKMVGEEGLERVNVELFPVWKLVLIEEITRVTCLHLCLFDWDGENQHQNFWQFYNRGVDEGLALQILHNVEDQAYGARGKASTFYCLQVQLPEGPIICCYRGGGGHCIIYYLFIEVSWPIF